MSDYSAVAPPQNFSQSSAFAAALQRAKQIAAKINPANAQNSQDGSKKRSLEDISEPETKKLASDSLSGMRGSSSSSSSDSGRTSSSAALGVIGRGGEQITRLQSETGCKIQMGSEPTGLSDRTCTISGQREAVNRAKELVQSIVNQKVRTEGSGDLGGNNPNTVSHHPGMVEIMIPGPKVGLIIGKGGETIKQLQEKSGAKMVIIQDGPGQESEKPLRITGAPDKVDHAKELVYELIAEKEMQTYNRGGFSDGGGYQGGSRDGIEVLVPKAAVGVVIGKGGEMIKKLQQETGCKVQFLQLKDNDGPGDRKCLLTGKQPNIEQARQRILELIEGINGRPNEYGGWDRRNDGKVEFSYSVPTNKCGIIIGKGGETIKQINQMTGAHCELDRKNQGTETEKFFLIRGTPEQVEHAKRVFGEKLGGGMQNMYQNPAMGYNTWNNAGYQGWPGQTTADMSGGQQQVQINPATGQPDYSSQWAEYYRSMGMHREAEMIEQQAKQQQQVKDMSQQQGGNPAAGQQQMQPQQQQQQPQSNTQNGGQADYSAQWAEYYRSMGKLKEAEAIEAQMKSGKLGQTNNQMNQPQPQMQNMQNPGAQAGGAPNAFQQPYGGYQTMNPAAPTANYYTPGAPTSQPQQNATFPTGGYQNYQYSQQPNSEN